MAKDVEQMIKSRIAGVKDVVVHLEPKGYCEIRTKKAQPVRNEHCYWDMFTRITKLEIAQDEHGDEHRDEHGDELGAD